MIFSASGSILAEEIRFRKGLSRIVFFFFFSYLGWAWGGLLGKSSSGILNCLFGNSLDESDNGFIISMFLDLMVILTRRQFSNFLLSLGGNFSFYCELVRYPIGLFQF